MSKKIKTKTQKRILNYFRRVVQLLFFIFLPSAFTSAFSGVKYIFTQIGLKQSIEFNSFVAILIVLCGFTIVFGRLFCGFACAFGSLGDAVHGSYLWICKKIHKKPIQFKGKWEKKLLYIKYLLLSVIVLLCFSGVYSKMSGWNPWDVFSLIRSGNFHLAGYIVGIVLFVLILIGMALHERFFCKFLCPMGAVFSWLPVIPLFSLRRDKNNCIKGCSACKRCCPANISLPDKNEMKCSGDCFQCQKCVNTCPKNNIHIGFFRIHRNEIVFTLLRILILSLLLYLAGV
ncbi:MAG: 4Fe-4S binding protein [Ruminococcus sp.]|nr:4Fe-4S binding protein [Ruminococcus sp.]